MAAYNILVWIMAAFALLGGIDRILGNRFGYGEKFEKGFQMLGNVGLSMAGIICLVPVFSRLLSGRIASLLQHAGIDPAMFGSLIAIDMGGYQLAKDLAEDPAFGRFAAVIVSSIFGCTVVFTIPYVVEHMPVVKTCFNIFKCHITDNLCLLTYANRFTSLLPLWGLSHTDVVLIRESLLIATRKASQARRSEPMLFRCYAVFKIELITLHLSSDALALVCLSHRTDEHQLIGSLLLNSSMNNGIRLSLADVSCSHCGVSTQPNLRHIVGIVLDKELSTGVLASKCHIGQTAIIEHLISVALLINLNRDV